MKKLFLVTVLALSVAFLGTGCSKSSGVPPILTADDIDITVGESRPYDLTSQGFETTFSGRFMAVGELPGKSWLSTPLSASKDNHSYADLSIYNPNKETKLYGLSTIYKVEFKMHSEDREYWTENTY